MSNWLRSHNLRVRIFGAVCCSAPVFIAAGYAPILDEPDAATAAWLEREHARSAARFQAELDGLVEHSDGPVGVLVTIDDGAFVATYTAGAVALDAERPPAPSDHMRIASLAKAMTAATALSLVDEGVLRLTDTVGDWLPDQPAAFHAVTLYELLNHTSGVPDIGRTSAFAEAISASPTLAPAPEKILAFAGTDPDFAPGERYAYSNSNPFLSGLIIEAATGRSFADVLRERVLEPLGMRDTYLPANTDPSLAQPTLRAYATSDEAKEDVTEVISFGGWAWASGGIVSTAEDLQKFVKGYIGDELLSSGLKQRQRAQFIPGDSEPRGPGDNSVGPGLFRYETRCGRMYGHTGSILGYTQFMAADTDGTRAITFTISSQYTRELLPELREAEEHAVCLALARD